VVFFASCWIVSHDTSRIDCSQGGRELAGIVGEYKSRQYRSRNYRSRWDRSPVRKCDLESPKIVGKVSAVTAMFQVAASIWLLCFIAMVIKYIDGKLSLILIF